MRGAIEGPDDIPAGSGNRPRLGVAEEHGVTIPQDGLAAATRHGAEAAEVQMKAEIVVVILARVSWRMPSTVPDRMPRPGILRMAKSIPPTRSGIGTNATQVTRACAVTAPPPARLHKFGCMLRDGRYPWGPSWPEVKQ